MDAYKVDEIVTENGLAILEGLPLPIGLSVEVIVLDRGQQARGKADATPTELLSRPVAQSEYLLGISSLMTEWESDADESAYQNL